MAISQQNRPIKIATPLGEDKLLFYRMHGTEKLCELFEFELELLSEDEAIDPDRLLGENVTVALGLAEDKWRYFNGYVARFGQYEMLDGFAVYRMTLRPWLWFLTRAANCRIFQDINVPDIVKQVFRDQGFSDIQEKLSGTYAVREYCVQYRETDFNFACRLLEEEGIYFYFTHENGKHHLVLADSGSAHDKFPGYESIPYHAEQGGIDKTRTDHIHEWVYSHSIQPGTHVLSDYDFKKPKAGLIVKSSLTMPHTHAGYEIFDYPGGHKEIGVGEGIVRSRMEARRAQFESFEGQCNARGLGVGNLFKLTEHRKQSQNREYLVVSAEYRLQLDSYIASSTSAAGADLFQCGFSAINSSLNYRPPRITPKPLVHGAQTAVVTGPAGEEIHTDQYGRVKVQFHWDRYGKHDEHSSCWMRVAQPWAGKNWGMMAIPRIGQEVVVEFLEGDPDQPLITGSVYNNSQMPPYPLPANKTQSGIKSRSSKGGQPAHFNEIRFEDKKGSEQVYIHAEKNLDTSVENCESHSVGANRTKTIGHDETTHVKHNRTETVDHNETVTVGKDILITAGDSITLTVGASTLVMKSNGSITLNGITLDVTGSEHIQLDSTRIDLN